MSINQLSEKLLLAVKMGESTLKHIADLETISYDQIVQLKNDNTKKAFWINMYNALFQILRQERNIQKPGIYSEPHFTIGSKKISLDDIEHGILRRFRYKYSLGYLPNPFAPKWIKKWALKEIDYRIHFALNCGAKSCPPIAFYTVNNIEAQLDMATISFLENETTIAKRKKVIYVTRLFKWFLGDFGGKKGIKRILKEKIGVDPEQSKLVFKDYSWEEDLANFAPSTFDLKS